MNWFSHLSHYHMMWHIDKIPWNSNLAPRSPATHKIPSRIMCFFGYLNTVCKATTASRYLSVDNVASCTRGFTGGTPHALTSPFYRFCHGSILSSHWMCQWPWLCQWQAMHHSQQQMRGSLWWEALCRVCHLLHRQSPASVLVSWRLLW